MGFTGFIGCRASGFRAAIYTHQAFSRGRTARRSFHSECRPRAASAASAGNVGRSFVVVLTYKSGLGV